MLFCLVYLRWVFIKGVFAVGSEVVAVCDILILKTLHFVVITCRVCYVLFWACFWLRDFGLFFLIVWFDWLFRLVVFVIDFAFDWWGLVWKKKNKGLTVHCNVAFVKPYVKMSARWFKRLILWFGRVLFVVKTLLCSERRFASGAS